MARPSIVRVVEASQGTANDPNAVGPTLTMAVDATGGNALIVQVAAGFNTNNPAYTTTGVTYNGVAMTLIGQQRDTFYNSADVSAWYLANPPAGTHNVVASVSNGGNPSDSNIVAAIVYQDVDTSDPYGTPVTAITATGGDSTASITVSDSTSDDTVVCLMSTGTSIDADTGGQTNIWSNTGTNNSSGGNATGEYMDGASGPITFSWNIGNDGWQAVAFTLHGVTSGGGSPVTVTPPVASLALTTFAPSVRTPVVVVPPVKALALTTFAPAVRLPKTVTPPVKALTLATFTPSVLLPRVVTPPVKALVLTTFAPLVRTPVLVGVPVKALSLTGFAPSIGIGVVITPPVKALTLTSFAPSIRTPVLVTVPVKALTLTGLAPLVSVGQVVTPPTLALVLATFAPQAVTPRRVVPPVTALVLTTFAPLARLNKNIIPPVKDLVLTTFAPEVVFSLNIVPDPAVLMLVTFPPIITATGPTPIFFWKRVA